MELKLISPLDMHLHLRDNDLLEKVIKFSSKYFSAAVVMPNITPPVTTKEEVISYKNKILALSKNDAFKPLMTLFFKSTFDYNFLSRIKDEIFAIKLYPAGITTNSKDGVESISLDTIGDTLDAMSQLNIPLLVHGESNSFVLDREKDFLPTFKLLAKEFPKLKIVMEHISTKDATLLLDKYPNLYATITLHHLLITLDDVMGDLLNPHLFCKPIAKRDQDREALLNLALNAHPKVMFGSDSAPHPKEKKESSKCAAGIFSAPVILPALASLFIKYKKEENLQKFLTQNAKNIYNLDIPYKEVILSDTPFMVKDNYNGIVPFLANEKLPFSIKEVRCN